MKIYFFANTKAFWFVAYIITFSLQSLSQKESEINYLYQSPPGMEAVLFAPGIVSTPLYEHSAPAFSPDGKLVLWAVYDRRGFLLESRFENGTWTKPTEPTFIDTLYGYVYPSFSADGKKLYFSSDLKLPGYTQRTGNRIWEVSRTKNGWGTPTPFDTTASQGHNYAHSLTNSGTIYFSSGVSSETNWNIRRSEKKNGRYTQPELLPYDINSKDYEDGAYIAPDESFLIFESQRPDGTDGNLSLFISFKNKKGQWQSPVNMGPKINSGQGERFARLSPDGKYLFFGSFRNPSPGSRGADIYWIDAKVIEELRNEHDEARHIDLSLGKDILEALNNKNYNRAAASLKIWLQSHPNSLDAFVLYSTALRRQKRYIEAAQLFKTNNQHWNGNTGMVMEMALIRFAVKDEAGARKLLAPVLAQPMDLRKKYAHLADELFSMNEFTLSDEYFDKAYALRPVAVALYNRACAYALSGQKTKAYALLNRAVDNGFNSKKQFEQDSDLLSLHSDPQWKALQKRLK